MIFSKKQFFLLLGLLLTYGLLFYFAITLQLRSDFPCFYAAADAYRHGLNPYATFIGAFLSRPVKLAVNLNPPFFLECMRPLCKLTCSTAIAVWEVLSLILGLVGANIVFNLLFGKKYLAKNRFYWLLIYLMLFSTLVNLSFGQIGAFMFFFIMAGYYFYIKKYDYLAGFLWGIIFALKLFPGLLLLFCLSQKRYKVSLVIVCTFITCSMIPIFTHGINIYLMYYKMMCGVLWYGANWNASINGYLFRLFVDLSLKPPSIFLESIINLFFSIAILIWYLSKIRVKNDDKVHGSFALTLVIMLLLSPFGWIYYFSILLLPLIFFWQTIPSFGAMANKNAFLWLVSIFLLNFPGNCNVAIKGISLFNRLVFFSMPFYGLVLLTYLISGSINLKQEATLPNYQQQAYILPVFSLIIVFGVIFILINFVRHFIACMY